MSASLASTNAKPVVLCLGGLDPLGCAGVLADQRMLTALGCHAAVVITTLTVQSTRQLFEAIPVDADLVLRQCRAIISELPVAAIKIGAIGSDTIARQLSLFLQSVPDIPVVFDPVIQAEGGGNLNQGDMAAVCQHLLPHCTLITPNSLEAAALGGQNNAAPRTTQEAAQQLLQQGCRYVLITGGHSIDEHHPAHIVNRLFDATTGEHPFSVARQRGDFRGTGCGFASAIAGLIAQGLALPNAIEQAQHRVSAAIAQAYHYSSGKQILDPHHD